MGRFLRIVGIALLVAVVGCLILFVVGKLGNSDKDIIVEEVEYSKAEEVYKAVNNKSNIDKVVLDKTVSYLSERLSESNVDTKLGAVITVDYSVFKNENSYRKEILDKLKNYSTIVSFVAVSPNFLSEEDMDKEFERITKIVSDNKDRMNKKFVKYNTNGLKNVVSKGSFAYSVTFVKGSN